MKKVDFCQKIARFYNFLASFHDFHSIFRRFALQKWNLEGGTFPLRDKGNLGKFGREVSYHDLLKHFKITTLSARRVQYDLLFLRNIFSGKINSADLLENFPLHVPPRSTRSQRLFAELPWRVKTVGEGFLRRIPKEMNSFLSRTGVDFFNDSVYSFRKCVLEYVRTF